MAVHRHFAQQLGAALVGEGGALLLVPVEPLRVAPDDHRGVSRYHPVMLSERNLEMQLGEQGELDAGERGHGRRHRAGGVDHHPGCYPIVTPEHDAGDGSTPDFDRRHLVGDELQTEGTTPVQHPCSQLLGAQPAGAADMDGTHQLIGEERESVGHSVRAHQEVGAFGCPVPSLRG